jgi:23S rRNA (guanosine2251-2'-O)-methyltransferase
LIVYGKQIFLYILEKKPKIVKKVYLAKDIEKELFFKLKKLGIEIVRVDFKKAQALSKGGNHQGYILEIEDFVFYELRDLKKGSFLVILYGITDVGNIGSIIRTAYALGVDGVVISGVNSLKMEGVIRRSSGAALDMQIALKSNVHEVIKELQDSGFKVYAADMDGEDVRYEKFSGKRAILLGSEGEGVPNRVLQKVFKRLKIKMKRDFDSLNVSAAAAIFIDRMRDE